MTYVFGGTLSLTQSTIAVQFDTIFTALHWMQGGVVARKVSVRPSVCLSDKRVNCDKTEEKSVQIFLYNTKDQLS